MNLNKEFICWDGLLMVSEGLDFMSNMNESSGQLLTGAPHVLCILEEAQTKLLASSIMAPFAKS